jgi:phosphohistidine phosphatase
MKLYIVRHAIAAPHGTPGIQDDDRALTEDGIKKMYRNAAGLRSLNFIPGIVLCSPLLRARQTAEILLEVFEKRIEMRIVDSLAPSGKRSDLYRVMSLYDNKIDSMMLVGHQPLLGEIAAEIAWGSTENYLEIKKGGACVIDLERAGKLPRGTLLSLLTPSILRKIEA